MQVADRFHLWQNLAEDGGKTVLACLAAYGPAARPGQPAGPGRLPGPRRAGSRTGSATWTAASAAGRPAPGTLRRRPGCCAPRAAPSADRPPPRAGPQHRTAFAHAASIDELLVKATSRPSILDPFKPYLGQRWNDGITNAAALHEEIRARGWTGGIQAVERYLRQFRTADGRDRQARARPRTAPSAPAPPKTRQITSWLLRRPETLTDDEHAQLAAIRARCPHIDALAGHVTSFAQMMTHRTGQNDLETWLAAAETSDLPELRSFAHGIRRDQQAVTNGLTLPYSSGTVEGTVNKIKMLSSSRGRFSPRLSQNRT